MMYESETWTFTKTYKRKLGGIQRRMERPMLENDTLDIYEKKKFNSRKNGHCTYR